jgi:hypothetical protein
MGKSNYFVQVHDPPSTFATGPSLGSIETYSYLLGVVIYRSTRDLINSENEVGVCQGEMIVKRKFTDLRGRDLAD